MKTIKEMFITFTNSKTPDAIILNVLATYFSFIFAFTHHLVIDNSSLFMSVTFAVFGNSFFGIWANFKQFSIKKASKIALYLGSYYILTAIVLSIEKDNPSVFWLAESVVTPILIFNIINIVKNMSKIGLIPGKIAEVIKQKLDSKANTSTEEKININQ